MFAKFKKQATEAYQQGKDKVQEVKKEYKDKKQGEWTREVVLEDKTFKSVSQWFEIYEPSGAKSANAKEQSKSSQILQEKMNEVMVNTMATNVMRTIFESLATASESASIEIKGIEPQIYGMLNSITSLFLTYRFQSKNKKKFQYLRGLTVDRFAMNFIEYLDQEAQALGQDPANISEEALQQIVDKIVDKICTQIENKKELTVQKFKSSALFNVAGLQNNDEIDEIIKMVMDIMQTYGEQKINDTIGQLRQELPQVFKVFIQYQQAIRANLIHFNKHGDNSPEYDAYAKEQIVAEIDSKYYKLKNFVSTFIGRFSGLIMANGGKEVTEEEEKQN